LHPPLSARKAAEIVKQLITVRKCINKSDLYIAPTALVNYLVLKTFNMKHFINIDGPELLNV